MRRDAGSARGGVRVLVTRAEPPRGPLCRLLSARGARVVHWPAYRIVHARSAALRAALAELSGYDWVAFTSGNAVAAVAAAGADLGAGPRIAAVGRSTAAAVREHGWPVALVPRRADAAALARALVRCGVRGKRILLPVSERSLPTLAERLRDAGARVDCVVAYRLAPLRRGIRRSGSREFDVVTFTSPSTIDGLAERLGARALRELLASTPAVVMGATTARALAGRGVRAAARARPTTLAGLVNTVMATARRGRAAQGVDR